LAFIDQNKQSFIKHVQKHVVDENKILFYYPEGKRNPYNKCIPIKQGGIQIIYNLKLPVQIQWTFEKSKMFNEFEFSCNESIQPRFVHSQVFDPSKYSTFQNFFHDIQTCWNNFSESEYVKP
jgi:1-acyl-sn-glycerol-3-phosphate acyltransferase